MSGRAGGGLITHNKKIMEVAKLKYIFNFTEINTGSVEIEADKTPSRADVINAIESGNAFYKDTEYGEILLVDSERKKSRQNRDDR